MKWLILVLLVVSGCKGRTTDADLAATDKNVQLRHHPLRITFDKWGDVVFVDVATQQNKNTCTLLTPRVRDNSTLPDWHVLQVYWLIYDKPEQVEWKEVRDTFFDSDFVNAKAMVDFGEPNPMGFLNLTAQHKKHFSFGAVSLNAERNNAQMNMGAPINAVVRLQAQAEGERCVVAAMYCPSNLSCTQVNEFKPMKHIHISQNWMYKPTKVTFK